MKTIRIGIDARMFSDNFTGIGRYTFELTTRLFEKKTIEISGIKYLVKWIVFLNDPEYSNYSFPKNVKKIKVQAGHYSLAEQTRFLTILKKAKCDLVHFTHFNVPLFYRRNFVVTIHDTTLSFFPGKNTNIAKRVFYKLVIQNAIKSSQRVITVSINTKKDITKIFKTHSDKITCVWNGLTDSFRSINETEKKYIKKKYNLSDKYLFYSGVWREHKNIKGLLKSFAEVLKNTNKSQEFSDLQLVLTGTPHQEVLDLAKELGISKRIKAVNKVPLEDLVLLMGAAEAFVFPSFYEGFGLPPLEAMKAKIPVISSNTSAMPEVCGNAAHFFDPKNIENMAEKILEVLTDEHLQKKLIENGNEQIKKFSWDDCAKQTFEIYRSALQ